MSGNILFIYSPEYCVDIGLHVFKTVKYSKLAQRLLDENLIGGEQIIPPESIHDEDLARALDPDYLDDIKELRRTQRTVSSELPISRQIIDGARLCAGGTLLAARRAIAMPGIGFHIGGGWHHAFASHAEGFCYINDLAVAILALRDEGAVRKAAVIDCDLHQGNGTAHYFAGDPDVFTFSIHQQILYPEKQKSDLDIGLDHDTADAEYLERLEQALPRIYEDHQPEIVFYVAGADPYEKDQLGDLRISKQGLRKRDDLVIAGAARRKIPLVITLAGGYAPDVNDTVDIHFATAQSALESAARYQDADP